LPHAVKAFGNSAIEPSIVGICEHVLIGSPQDPQNLFSGGFCAEHFGHGIAFFLTFAFKD
jgi:hypothetical protein